ncbi:MAG: ferrous iron transport protein B [Flavobacteriales bacterium]|nr:MAG: ferrous iron transport protein B [Flavobacteriales bacterium]
MQKSEVIAIGSKTIKVALVGNPNTGKSLLFNQLTGLHQKVSNHPGVTVEKKTGTAKLSADTKAVITDLPGTYSINPSSLDENIVLQTFLNVNKEDYPDIVVVLADVENIKRNLYLFSQIKDLEIPTILAINMADRMKSKGITLDLEKLKEELGAQAVLISAKKNIGIQELKNLILNYKKVKQSAWENLSKRIDSSFFKELAGHFTGQSVYRSWLFLTQHQNLSNIDNTIKKQINTFKVNPEKLKKLQNRETILRYQQINNTLKKTYSVDTEKADGIRAKLDRILTHKVYGYVIFAAIMLLVFQSIFEWATLPMDLIDEGFARLSEFTKDILPAGMLTDLLSEGVIPGIGGVVIFIPQIAILFLFIAILEETGYMSRVVFLMDKIMRRFGMSGKSVVPLISGTACAIPAIMATRNIESWKERLITILVTPFIICSARLPVYAIIIALVIPKKHIMGFLNVQGLTLMGLYVLGFLTAIIGGYILNKTLKIKSKSFFVIEMPNFKTPALKNVLFTVIDRTKAFVFGAGKIILAISIILWFLASHGPANFNNVEEIVKNQNTENITDETDLEAAVAQYKLENSYLGIAGKAIEPAIRPLGYDWKIGIALLSSFAAREVFVSTLATIYNVGDSENTATIKENMRNDINQHTGKKLFTLPVGLSLMMFYAFAMQCISTLAIVKRETFSYKWPIIQLIGMTVIAYVAAWFTYTVFSL